MEKKIVCGSCSTQVNDSQLYCHECGSEFSDKAFTIAFSVAKNVAKKVKEAVKFLDPTAKLSKFTPVKGGTEGIIVKTKKPILLKAYVQENKFPIVPQNRLAI